MGFFKKFFKGFGKTREALVTSLQAVVATGELDEDKLEEMEEILIMADLGVDTTLQLMDRLRKRANSEVLIGNGVIVAMAEELEDMLSSIKFEEEVKAPEGVPHVTFVIGINGSGKTTTIGKLCQKYASEGEKILIVAADTFRSAAVEQVSIWAERANVDIVKGAEGADPASVVYDGLQAAMSRQVDRVFVDTAGRLHTKVNLMKELEKLDRVAKKVIPTAPHEVLLVADGTTGQNGLVQAKAFSEACGVTSLIVTKLDGTAKGGVIVPIGRELGIPVRWVGLGEGIDDLLPYDAKMVVHSVFGGVDFEELAKKAEEEREQHESENIHNLSGFHGDML